MSCRRHQLNSNGDGLTNERSANNAHDRRLAPGAHGSLQSETRPRLLRMRIHRSQTHQDNMPGHRVKGDTRRVRTPLQHEFPAGARALQMVQSILLDLGRLPSLAAPPSENVRSISNSPNLHFDVRDWRSVRSVEKILFRNWYSFLTSVPGKRFQN